jgi:hypothetical protein
MSKFSREEQQVYWVWGAMVARCHNPKNPQYRDYGGRGIAVCPEWRTAKNFMADMMPRPEGAVLDRIDNNAGYSKQNCRWVTYFENNKNKRVYKCSVSGISGVVARHNGWRVRLRHGGKIVVDIQVSDFFEACCVRKAAEVAYVHPYLPVKP